MANSDELDQQLSRWIEGGLLDLQSAETIRIFEKSREAPGVRWPVLLAIAFGTIMVAAGILLFVAAHWDELSPTQRFLLVLLMIFGSHLSAGALMPRLRSLGIALHGVGTVALGGGIFLAAQIFNLQEHWPGGILLWAIGATLSWILLRDWLQGTLAALLVPAWIISEWGVRAEHFRNNQEVIAEFVAMVAITYLSARHGKDSSYFRRALVWVGGLVVLPACAVLAVGNLDRYWNYRMPPMTLSLRVSGWIITFVLPLLAAWLLRGRALMWNIAFALWVFSFSLLDRQDVLEHMLVYMVCALGAIGLVYWGLQEQRRERINLGVAGFAITIIVFYFSDVMDKLGRSASLIGFGLLFLLGGWKLEQLRRKLVARAAVGES